MSALITAVIVTRGDQPLDEILASIPKDWDTAVWDNGARQLRRDGAHGSYQAEWSGNEHYGPLRDISVYGRYEAIDHVDGNVIVVQDDDCVLTPEAFDELVAAYKPGHVVCNMPERFRPHYPDSALVGFGAIFDRHLPANAFNRFAAGNPTRQTVAEWDAHQSAPLPSWAHDAVGLGENFYRECDTVFTALTPRILIDAPYSDLPWANADNRLWKQREHFGERRRMLNLVRQVRDA